MNIFEEQQPPIRTGLLDFLKKSTGSQFVIPVYQRNYTWKSNDEVLKYLNDIKSVMEGVYPKHFLGIIIYLDTPLDTFSREFSVIDGQQRLTTTFLILYSIRAILLENDKPEIANMLEKQFLINEFVADKLKFKLKPLVADDTVYSKLVKNQIETITEEEKNSNVYKNYFFIKAYIEECVQNGATIESFLDALNKLYVVCIPISKSDNAQKIFESINSTGAKLSASDLIRNYILMDIQSDIQENYYSYYWKELENLVSSDSKKLEAFFRYFLASQNKTLPGASKVYDCYKVWHEGQLKEMCETEQILAKLVEYAKYYNLLSIKKIDEINTNFNSQIKEFRKTFSDMPIPFLLEILHLNSLVNEQGVQLVDDKTVGQIISLVNTYLMRRQMCALDTSDITRLFPSVLMHVLDECNEDYTNIYEYTKKWLVNQNRGKAAYMPDDKQLSDYLTNANVYINRSTLKVVFDKVETFGNPAVINLKDLSVEHLMPQTPTNEWLEALNIDEETYEKNLHRLGNLTLATKPDNSKMSNNPWEYKKLILEDTAHIKMNKEILDLPKWDIEEIDKRTIALIEKIKKLYPYEQASDAFIEKYEIYILNKDLLTTGYLYEDGTVEIQQGSTFVKYDSPHPVLSIDEEYHQLVEEGIIVEDENESVFAKPYLFETPSRAASLILHGNRNGFDYWCDSTNQSINKSGLRKKLGL